MDTLCRLVTGEGDSKRVLYTDDNDFVFEMKRAILLNDINQPTDRSDARDRTLPIELQRIPDHERRCEEELWEVFDKEHPKLLGAILDALSRTLKVRSPSSSPAAHGWRRGPSITRTKRSAIAYWPTWSTQAGSSCS